ncbi:hypothetical protein NA56DRAFT_704525 [Hyaloscypha hepaticicola]|uniref:Uncharacterized protein n=1 Tax=Hyaloscypha hepaticicola TaxID=2082293 RepID=A0A2J6Q3A1_9HELO|nr:hypothetical protein NA56DRAFT_704525 [Hyaloscypha hepaticicola]
MSQSHETSAYDRLIQTQTSLLMLVLTTQIDILLTIPIPITIMFPPRIQAIALSDIKSQPSEIIHNPSGLRKAVTFYNGQGSGCLIFLFFPQLTIQFFRTT